MDGITHTADPAQALFSVEGIKKSVFAEAAAPGEKRQVGRGGAGGMQAAQIIRYLDDIIDFGLLGKVMLA
jgi:hypothetical protein